MKEIVGTEYFEFLEQFVKLIHEKVKAPGLSQRAVQSGALSCDARRPSVKRLQRPFQRRSEFLPMNPSPNPPRPFNPPPRLVGTYLPPPGYVPVTLTRGFPATSDSLGVIERQWERAREELAAELRAHGETLESAHWQWTDKAEPRSRRHNLVTVECEGQIQGVMAVENLLRKSVLTPNAWVLYVDYVEVAPWNYRVPQDRNAPAVRVPRFTRVGTLLIGEAIRMSLGAAAGGRVGLHGLPQAEAFYVGRCGMTRIGPDPNYQDLVYFEYPDGVAARQLTVMELSA
ncbi:hypothetical protein [Gemmata sp. SH-PL17]|uniref:hypothetical protein n=1 Tax=Gemmata sp. SH-PL17 TaxID=1630693 RepID=UPI0012F7562E|nr:hypothetical protein [Gemmata sp. SH-PL17]